MQEPDYTALWAAPMRALAEVRIKHKAHQLPVALAKAVNQVLSRRGENTQVTVTQTGAWLRGEEAPADAMVHQALLIAMGLHYSKMGHGSSAVWMEDPAGQSRKLKVHEVTPLMEKFIGLRAQLNDLYEDAQMEMLTRPVPEETGAAPKTPGCIVYARSRVGLIVGDAYYDEKAQHHEQHYRKLFAPREHNSAIPYQDLSHDELYGIVGRTRNPAEFLAAWRALMPGEHGGCMSQREADEIIGLSRGVSEYEIGNKMPSPKSLHRMANFFDAPAMERYVQLIIETRLRIMHHHEARGNQSAVASELSCMPREYWREAIRHLLNDQTPGYPVPVWSDQVLPIQSQGEYLRAMRYAYGKPLNVDLDKTAAPIFGMRSAHAMVRAESNHVGYEDVQGALVQFYQTLQQERLAGIDRYPDTGNKPPMDWKFFDPSRFDPASEHCLPTNLVTRECKATADTHLRPPSALR